MADHELIPAPLTYDLDGGAPFRLDSQTAIDPGPGTEGAAHWLREVLRAATGLPLPEAGLTPALRGVVRLRIEEQVTRELGPEGYQLAVTSEGVDLVGGSPAGAFWGAQTIRQLLGPDAFRRAPVTEDADWHIPTLRIEDAPRFPWRGYMLDVARHFTPKAGVLRTIDLLAAHKLNVLHLHLTDDQGWRVEIERYPRLVEVGSWRRRSKLGHRHSSQWDERPHGGYYTRADLREIVAYAAERHITVVPEIDIPGHSQAAIAAYPELGNSDVIDTFALEVWDDWGINPNVLAPTDAVLRFYEHVWEEVLEIFPSTYVHIGGDECPKEQWRASPTAQRRIEELGLRDEDELQSWFIRHFDHWLAERGRRLVGWDEILEGSSRTTSPGGEQTAVGLSPGALVASWQGYEGGVTAARAGHEVVMCPKQFVYLDYRHTEDEAEPIPIAFPRDLADVYSFEPVPADLAGTEEAHLVRGAQANLWTEVVDDQQRADFQTYPRLAALAEVVWSTLPPPEKRDFTDFERRTGAYYARLDALGVDYRPPSGPLPRQQRPGILGRPLPLPEELR